MKGLRARVQLKTLAVLLAFGALAAGVYALAAGSAVAGVIAAVMVVLLAVAIVGFRNSASVRAESPRRETDRYKAMYREIRDNHEQLLQAAAVPGGDATSAMERRAA